MTHLHRAGKWQARRSLLQLLAAQSPTGQRLVQMRRLSGSPMCPLCGGAEDTLMHRLAGCQHATVSAYFQGMDPGIRLALATAAWGFYVVQ